MENNDLNNQTFCVDDSFAIASTMNNGATTTSDSENDDEPATLITKTVITTSKEIHSSHSHHTSKHSSHAHHMHSANYNTDSNEHYAHTDISVSKPSQQYDEFQSLAHDLNSPTREGSRPGSRQATTPSSGEHFLFTHNMHTI
jgi:hypothetical protein